MAGNTLIVANWKMNPPTFREARRLLEATKKAAEKTSKVLVVIAPPSIYLRELRHLSRGKKITFAAQNSHFENEGAFTGETSIAAIKDARATHVIIGHAERRALGETDAIVGKKVAAALAHKLTPILCIGETTRTGAGDHFNMVKEQIHAGLSLLGPQKVGKVVIAYEPVWAIGGQTAMSPRDMHEMAIFIRKTIVEMHGNQGHSVTILYGGSIEEGNAREMLDEGDVRGLLVGRVSEDPARMSALLQAIAGSK